ncbi:hypothetical protein PV10_03775 [Exophiala mesophila]|uniref:alpha-1,2-Mannosidase n=1 Tax=Exophiala mesophila TaxID=212818 RepID=A0A0D1XW98_EXOME|nr:uncharacterized protein PV10_03775 [Exophiala mesophila]KIV92481.1 hypothetical protein PV10_03775 [Exophiala mesophila]
MGFRRRPVALLLLGITIFLLIRRFLSVFRTERLGSVPASFDIPDEQPRPKDGYASHANEIVIMLPDTGTLQNPRIQHKFPAETAREKQTRLTRLDHIKEATLHAWTGYRKHAWMKDELMPVTGGHRTTLGGWAATLIDSLDTLWLMGLKDEFEEAVQAAATIDFDESATIPVNVFETTIRYLGGLLGAYDVSGGKYPILLRKALEVGDMLYLAFDTPSRMPITRWSKIGVEVAGGDTVVAELGTLTLEFTRLTQLTGDNKFYDAVQRIADCFEQQQGNTRVPGLFPHTVNARDCWFADGVTFSIGGSADSVYEYFPKQHQLLRGAIGQYKRMYETARDPLHKYLLSRPSTPSGQDMLLAGIYKSYVNGRKEFIPEVHHLSCFAGGMFALASRLFEQPQDLDTAKQLVQGCIWGYNQTVTGIMPERFRFLPCATTNDDSACAWDEQAWTKLILKHSSELSITERTLSAEDRVAILSQRLGLPKGMPDLVSPEYYLRPEAIEAIFVLYRVTGDETLRETAWVMFENLVRHTRTEFGFSSIRDVTKPDSAKLDRMESFWIAETLKYFYLLFSDPSVISLDDFVLNTEGHPFRL